MASLHIRRKDSMKGRNDEATGVNLCFTDFLAIMIIYLDFVFKPLPES
jgi:hypothetical protein